MDEAVRRYIDGIEPASRALFDRVHRLIMDAHPEATISISYQIPTFRVGKRRLYLAAWKHGVSLYGWQADRDGGLPGGIQSCCPGRPPCGCGPSPPAPFPTPSCGTWLSPRSLPDR